MTNDIYPYGSTGSIIKAYSSLIFEICLTGRKILPLGAFFEGCLTNIPTVIFSEIHAIILMKYYTDS
jgi:hypothetical protein